MAQLIHQGPEFLFSNLSIGNPFQPVAEKFVERRVPVAGVLPGQFDVGLVGAKSNILSHEDSVHEFSVPITIHLKERGIPKRSP